MTAANLAPKTARHLRLHTETENYQLSELMDDNGDKNRTEQEEKFLDIYRKTDVDREAAMLKMATFLAGRL